MILKKIIITCLVLAFCSVLVAQNNTNSSEPPYIEVDGVAKLVVIPDQIYVHVFLEERHEGKETITIEMQENQLKEIVKSLGIDVKDMGLKKTSAQYGRVRMMKKGVKANAQYVIKVKNAKTVIQLFEKLEVMKIKNAYVGKIDHSKMDSLKKEVRIDAITAGKAKAEYLVEAIGEKLEYPLIIKEKYSGHKSQSQNNYLNQRRWTNKLRMEDGILEDFDDEVDFEKIVITANVYLKYKIKTD